MPRTVFGTVRGVSSACQVSNVRVHAGGDELHRLLKRCIFCRGGDREEAGIGSVLESSFPS